MYITYTLKHNLKTSNITVPVIFTLLKVIKEYEVIFYTVFALRKRRHTSFNLRVLSLGAARVCKSRVNVTKCGMFICELCK